MRRQSLRHQLCWLKEQAEFLCVLTKIFCFFCFSVQRNIQDLKNEISQQSKKNFKLDKDLRFFDSRIALLINHKITVEVSVSLSIFLTRGKTWYYTDLTKSSVQFVTIINRTLTNIVNVFLAMQYFIWFLSCIQELENRVFDEDSPMILPGKYVF